MRTFSVFRSLSLTGLFKESCWGIGSSLLSVLIPMSLLFELPSGGAEAMLFVECDDPIWMEGFLRVPCRDTKYYQVKASLLNYHLFSSSYREPEMAQKIVHVDYKNVPQMKGHTEI